MDIYISQYEPSFDNSEIKALSDYMHSGGWITEFKETKAFEEMIAAYTGSKHAIAVNNGTIAITLAAMACGLAAGDKVLVPNYTMIATPNSLRLFGAIPVFVDVEPDTLCMDLDKAREKLDSEIKGIIFVPSNGRYPEKGIEEFRNFADKNSLIFIEDAAQGLGSYYPNGKHLGTIGSAGTLSFSSPKIITTGQGGMILTNDESINDKVRKLKDFGRSHGGSDIHESLGYNFKFTDIQAVIGIAQMGKLQSRIERKKKIFQIYLNELESLETVYLFHHDVRITTPWFIDAKVHNRDGLKSYLSNKHIGTRNMYPPINAQEAYKTPGHYPVSEEIGLKGLWLPSHPQLTDENIIFICKQIMSYYEKEKRSSNEQE
jgi:perosamine synthetase